MILRKNAKDSKPKEKLIIDMIAFTSPIKDKKKMSLINRINSPDLKESYKIKVYGSNYGRYNNNYKVEIYDGNSIELSMYPINKSHNFIRIKYNPAKLGKVGRKKLRRFLIKLLGLDILKTLYFHATVTRLDLTLDVFNMEPNLYIHKSKVSRSAIFRAKNGDIASQIVGSDQSDCRVTMYDKTLEQGHKENGRSANYQRIEIRMRELNCTMAELTDDLMREFEKLNFFCDEFFDDAGFSENFKDDVYDNGLNFALSQLDDNSRRRYRRYLKDNQVYPISLECVSFNEAHREAFSSLIHLEYRDEFLGKAA
ncbi:MAG: hypothetical protein Q8N96_15100 [Methylovulum sp.]|nr:hypothetical protein [Methylovulum sp.]